jgi:hypothetical protein
MLFAPNAALIPAAVDFIVFLVQTRRDMTGRGWPSTRLAQQTISKQPRACGLEISRYSPRKNDLVEKTYFKLHKMFLILVNPDWYLNKLNTADIM